jgi:hypothetical protein
MRKIHLSLLLSIVAFFATGCPNEPSKNFPSPNPDPTKLTTKSFVNNVNAYLRNQQLQYNNAVQYLNTLPPGTAPDAVQRAENNARRIRNDAIEDAIAVIDSNYNDYITRLNTRRSTADFIADVVELGTAGAIGFINGERPNQILGIALTAFRGGRRSSELNFYKEQTVPILINKMDDGRAQVYATLLKKKVESVNDYSIKEAIRDIVAYYNAGTLIRAFTQLQKDAAAGAKESENRVLILKGIPVTPPATEAERDEAVESSDTLFALRKSLRDTATAQDRAAATQKLQAIVTELGTTPALATMLTDAGLAANETDGAKLLKAIVDIKRAAFDNADLSRKIDQVIVSKGK